MRLGVVSLLSFSLLLLLLLPAPLSCEQKPLFFNLNENNILLGTHHKTGTHVFRTFQRFLLDYLGGDRGHIRKSSCKCWRAPPAQTRLCLACNVNTTLIEPVVNPPSSSFSSSSLAFSSSPSFPSPLPIRMIHSVRSPLSSIISQRGYQVRLRQAHPHDKRFDKLSSDDEFYQAIDAGDEVWIWQTTVLTMKEGLQEMLDVMQKTEKIPTVHHVDLDKIMANFSSSMSSVLSHLLPPPPPSPTHQQLPPSPLPRGVSKAEQVKMVKRLAKHLDVSGHPELENAHVQEKEEKKRWKKEFMELVSSSSSSSSSSPSFPEFREVAEMERLYQSWWKRNPEG